MNGTVHVTQPYQRPPCSLAVTRLLHHLSNIFRERLRDDEKNLPVVDKKQRREIEEKKQGEITY